MPECINLVLLNPDMPCLCKQCRSRSVGFWKSQLIWICTVCHSVCEFISIIWIKESDWLAVRSGHRILIYSAWQGLSWYVDCSFKVLLCESEQLKGCVRGCLFSHIERVWWQIGVFSTSDHEVPGYNLAGGRIPLMTVQSFSAQSLSLSTFHHLDWLKSCWKGCKLSNHHNFLKCD